MESPIGAVERQVLPDTNMSEAEAWANITGYELHQASEMMHVLIHGILIPISEVVPAGAARALVGK